MEWNKAGKKPKNVIGLKHNKEQEQEYSPKWTKSELELKPGIKYLVAAVIEQWQKDGQPQDPGIKPWLSIAKLLNE